MQKAIFLHSCFLSAKQSSQEPFASYLG